MDKHEFIEAINITVHKSVTPGVRKLLDKPPGRKPSEEMTELSNWFNELSVKNQEMVMRVANIASRHATFGFLCVLDGVRVIESGRDKGELNLFYKKGRKKVLINDQEGDFLHDLFNEIAFRYDKSIS